MNDCMNLPLAEGIRHLEEMVRMGKAAQAVLDELTRLRHELEQAGTAAIAFEGLAEGLYRQQHAESVLREEA